MELCEENTNSFHSNPKVFHDLGMVPPTVNTLEDLIKELNKVFSSEHVNIDVVEYLMRSYKSNPADWKKYAKFDRFR